MSVPGLQTPALSTQPAYMAPILELFGGTVTGLSIDELAQISGLSKEEVIAKLQAAGINTDDPEFRLTPATLTLIADPSKAQALLPFLNSLKTAVSTPQQRANIELLAETLDQAVGTDLPAFASLAEFDTDHDGDVDALDLSHLSPEKRDDFIKRSHTLIAEVRSGLDSHQYEGLDALKVELGLADLLHLVEGNETSVDLAAPNTVCGNLKIFDQNQDGKLDEADIKAVMNTGSPERTRALRDALALNMSNIQAELINKGATLAPSEYERLVGELEDLRSLMAGTGVLALDHIGTDAKGQAIDLTEFDGDGDGNLTVSDIPHLSDDQRAQLQTKLTTDVIPALDAKIRAAEPGSQDAKLWTQLKANAEAILNVIQHPPEMIVAPGSPLVPSAAVANDAAKTLLNEADIKAMNSEQLQSFVRAADEQLQAKDTAALTPEARSQLALLRESAIARLSELAPTDEKAADALGETSLYGLSVAELLLRLVGMFSKMRYSQRNSGFKFALNQFDCMLKSANEQHKADREKAWGEFLSGMIGIGSAVASGALGGYSMKLSAPKNLEQPLDTNELNRLNLDNQKIAKLRDAENPDFTKKFDDLGKELKGYEDQLASKKYELAEPNIDAGKKAQLEKDIADLEVKKAQCHEKWNQELKNNANASLKDFDNLTASLDNKIKNLEADIKNPNLCPDTPQGHARRKELEDQIEAVKAQKVQVETMRRPRELEIAAIDQDPKYLELADRHYVCEMKKDPVRWEHRTQDPRYQEAQARHSAALQKVQNKANSLAFIAQPIGQGVNSFGQGADDYLFKLDAADMEYAAKVLQAISDLAQRAGQVSDQDEQHIGEMMDKVLSALEDYKRFFAQMQL